MKSKIKVVSILALLTIGLVSCGKSNEPISSSSSSSIISSTTIYCGNVSTVIIYILWMALSDTELKMYIILT